MAQAITQKTATGIKIVGIEPTTDTDTLRRAHITQRKVDERAAKLEAERAKKEQKERRRRPSEQERRTAIVDGLKRAAKQADRRGEEKTANRIRQHAEEAKGSLQEYEVGTKALLAPRPDPIGDAITAGAAEVRKLLPGCFPTEADAQDFARHLPMVEARAEAGRLADHFAGLARQRKVADSKFWRTVEAGGRLAFGAGDDNQNIKRLLELGL